jgi:hypothetical protein
MESPPPPQGLGEYAACQSTAFMKGVFTFVTGRLGSSVLGRERTHPLAHRNSPAGGAKSPACRCTQGAQVIPCRLTDATLALGRHRCDLGPADVHSEKVSIPCAVEPADGCGWVLQGTRCLGPEMHPSCQR